MPPRPPTSPPPPAAPPRLLCAGPRDEQIILRWRDALGVRVPFCDGLMNLYGQTYRDILIDPTQAGTVRDELEALRRAVEERRGDELARERRVHARAPEIRAQLLEPLLAADPDVARLRELVAIADQAVVDRGPIYWSGD